MDPQLSKGFCYGAVIVTINMRLTETFCLPASVNLLQALRVTVEYMEQKPQELHLHLADVTERAGAGMAVQTDLAGGGNGSQ